MLTKKGIGILLILFIALTLTSCSLGEEMYTIEKIEYLAEIKVNGVLSGTIQKEVKEPTILETPITIPKLGYEIAVAVYKENKDAFSAAETLAGKEGGKLSDDIRVEIKNTSLQIIYTIEKEL